jgi:hypothetical protein
MGFAAVTSKLCSSFFYFDTAVKRKEKIYFLSIYSLYSVLSLFWLIYTGIIFYQNFNAKTLPLHSTQALVGGEQL